MKKTAKVIGVILLALVGIILLASLYVESSGIPVYKTSEFVYPVKSTPELVERGEKLTSMLCASCHLNHETGKLSGIRMLDAPAEFGVIYSQNITQDKEFGIGEWTNAELVYLFRTGIKRDGKYAPPYMAKLPKMADKDIDAIIAFLKSDHTMVTADATPDLPCEPSFLTKVLCQTVFKPFPMPETPIAMPDYSNSVELGEYLAHNLDCFSCHSADFKTNDFLNPTQSVGYFGGGNKPLDREGRVKLTPNLTPDSETGIGDWTKERFINAVKYGIKGGEPALVFPMIPYTQLTDEEAGAIFDYLQTIPAISNKVDRNIYE